MNILCTGSSGFLGKHLMSLLPDAYGVSSQTYDLRGFSNIDALFHHARPEIIFHLAADVGGLSYNLDNPASIYYNNVMMNTQLIQRAAVSDVKKFIFVSSACAYPKHNPLPTREHGLFKGLPEESNLSYGMSKRMALIQLYACYQQYGMDFSYPILSNLYGPGDHFGDDRSHVIPALIKKFIKDDKVIVWGDGSVTRDFLYVEDAARALIKCMEVEYREPVNIASGQSLSIRRLVDLISELTGYNGGIEFDTSRPTGQDKRWYDISKARDILGWQPEVDIREGLERTIEWYKCNLTN